MTGVPLRLRRLAFTVALVAVLVLLLLPASDVPSGNDKVSHFITFGVLALLGLWARWPVRVLVPTLLVYAVATEVAQATLTSTRHGDWRDALADAIGVGLGVALGGVVQRQVSARSNARSNS